jgi:hypothetical protein
MNIKNKAIHDAIVRLEAVQAQYHIVDAEGNVYGAAIVHKPKRTRKIDPNLPNNGEYIASILPEDAPVSFTAQIKPQHGDTLARLQANISAWCSKHWGNKSFMTSVNKEKGAVDVLRLS